MHSEILDTYIMYQLYKFELFIERRVTIKPIITISNALIINDKLSELEFNDKGEGLWRK